MRKVFISNVIMNTITNEPYKSRDFDLGDKTFPVPICYLLDANIEAGDEVLIVTGLTRTEKLLKNYEIIKNKMEEILSEHQAKGTFLTVDEPDAEDREKQDSLTFSGFLKQISDAIQDGDRLYVDMTFGLRIYTLATFIAMNYVLKACRDVRLEAMVYGQHYRGHDEEPASTDIVDVTALANINALVSDAKPGQKKELDKFLSFLID
ncbi:MAG: hypothetical protein J6N99_04835 [Schwartzia sp.]|nr:hypothetical protein [Schwartzia sp. (in: firmicutes)]